MKLVVVNQVTIPLVNIDYMKRVDYNIIYLKTGKQIECTHDEYNYVLAALQEAQL